MSSCDALSRTTPTPRPFEGWLLERALEAQTTGVGAMRAMALEVFHEWQLAATSSDFHTWLAAGAPSDDRES